MKEKTVILNFNNISQYYYNNLRFFDQIHPALVSIKDLH